jgi:hypothetical protein
MQLPSPQSIPRLRFRHRERRYLLNDLRVLSRLLAILPDGHAYFVETTYLDTPERTWSALTFGKHHPKIRFRRYDNRDGFLEKKLRAANGLVTKTRIPMSQIPDGLVHLGEIAYWRTEYTAGRARVTIDINITSGSHVLGVTVVEVKGRLPRRLRFLRPYEDRQFSKWKWASGSRTPDRPERLPTADAPAGGRRSGRAPEPWTSPEVETGVRREAP